MEQAQSACGDKVFLRYTYIMKLLLAIRSLQIEAEEYFED
jgi:hypothetical protein